MACHVSVERSPWAASTGPSAAHHHCCGACTARPSPPATPQGHGARRQCARLRALLPAVSAPSHCLLATREATNQAATAGHRPSPGSGDEATARPCDQARGRRAQRLVGRGGGANDMLARRLLQHQASVQDSTSLGCRPAPFQQSVPEYVVVTMWLWVGGLASACDSWGGVLLLCVCRLFGGAECFFWLRRHFHLDLRKHHKGCVSATSMLPHCRKKLATFPGVVFRDGPVPLDAEHRTSSRSRLVTAALARKARASTPPTPPPPPRTRPGTMAVAPGRHGSMSAPRVLAKRHRHVGASARGRDYATRVSGASSLLDAAELLSSCSAAAAPTLGAQLRGPQPSVPVARRTLRHPGTPLAADTPKPIHAASPSSSQAARPAASMFDGLLVMAQIAADARPHGQ